MNYGNGSVYQRSSDGRWMAAIEWPRERGRPRRRTVLTHTTREGAEGRLQAFLEQNPTGGATITGRANGLAQARSIATHTDAEWWAKVRATERRCAYCGIETTVYTMTQDHDIPVCRGGSDGIDNVVVACDSCNKEKHLMTGDEYRAWRVAQA